jgi:malate synthase
MSEAPKIVLPAGMFITAPVDAQAAQVLSPPALAFLARLERTFGKRRSDLLQARQAFQAQLDAGAVPTFLEETRPVREAAWQVAATPLDLQDRRVEITGPTDRKMLINALNSGANVFMADFEDANSPTWANMVEGQLNLQAVIRGDITFTSPEGKVYSLNKTTAVLMVRPRGWHLSEKHVLIDGQPISASLFDFGLFFFHNARALLSKGSGPYFYLPKLENHREARLWNDVFNLAQDELGIPRGTIRATVLIETILAAFEMEEILYELRTHSAGLNAGRWDYIFSIIKKFRRHPGFFLPDRSQVTMTTPFMRAYTELLVHTCHKRGAHAMGGMAAYIPSRKDPQVNEVALDRVRNDKLRESRDGFDGTWVAHPDLVPVAMEVFDQALGDKPNQKDRLREDVHIQPVELVQFQVPGGQITEQGVRGNINIALLYLASWLDGKGAAAIYNLMEDTATAEISRSQLWQWLHQPAGILADGRKLDHDLYDRFADEEMVKIRELLGEAGYRQFNFALARQLLDRLVTPAEFIDFLTLIAYDFLD